jgi:TonB family protein
MSPLLLYVIESTVCLALFYVFYALVQKKETSFRYNRIYLIGTFLLSFIIPAIKVTIQQPIPVISAASFNNLIQLPEITVATEMPAMAIAKPFEWTNLLIGLYFLGMSFFLIRFFYGLSRIILTIRKSRKAAIKLAKATIVPTNGKLPSCSFFGYIFWDGKVEKEHLEESQVFQHELAHVRHRHSWDILLMEVSSIVFWFNPIVHLFNKAIKEVHEYEIDAEITRTTDKEKYIKILAHQGLQEFDLALIHPFNKSHILKRINMLEKGWKRINWMRMTLIIPLIAAMALVFSCQTENLFDSTHLNELPEGWKILHKNEMSPELISDIEKLKNDNPGVEFHGIKIEKPAASGNRYWSLNSIRVDKERDMIMGIARAHPDGNSPMKDQRNLQSIRDGQAYDSEIFTIVEEPPAPVGGMRAFYEYVQRELKYPEEAKKDAIQGRVFIQFIVDKDGSITDVQAVRGIGGGCDEEAVRVIANSPKWIAGKQRGREVRVRMVMPITFTLGVSTNEQGRPEEVAIPNNVNPRPQAISGRVTNSNREPLSGVNVVIQGSQIGTITNVNGNYTITIPANATHLVYSYVGYVSKTLPINNAVMNVVLEKD